MRRRVGEYTIVEETLYKMGLSTPLLWCLRKTEANYALLEVHEGIIGQQLGERELENKVLREWYYWSAIVQYAQEYVKK